MSETKIQKSNCEKKQIESADCLAKVGVKDWLLYSEGALHKLQLFFLSIQSISFWGALIFAPPTHYPSKSLCRAFVTAATL